MGLLFAAVGCATLAGTFWRLARGGDTRDGALDYSLAGLSALAALAGGVGVLRGERRGRSLLALWMGAHIVISAMHSVRQLLAHAALFAVLALLLYRRSSSAYLAARGAAPR